jgi:hypothetical protein
MNTNWQHWIKMFSNALSTQSILITNPSQPLGTSTLKVTYGKNKICNAHHYLPWPETPIHGQIFHKTCKEITPYLHLTYQQHVNPNNQRCEKILLGVKTLY